MSLGILFRRDDFCIETGSLNPQRHGVNPVTKSRSASKELPLRYGKLFSSRLRLKQVGFGSDHPVVEVFESAIRVWEQGGDLFFSGRSEAGNLCRFLLGIASKLVLNNQPVARRAQRSANGACWRTFSFVPCCEKDVRGRLLVTLAFVRVPASFGITFSAGLAD